MMFILEDQHYTIEHMGQQMEKQAEEHVGHVLSHAASL
jgi:hypothetical protein